MKIAVVHDWLPVIAGGEAVLKEILATYPDSDVFTLLNFLNDEQMESLGIKNVKTSALNTLPFIEKYYRKLLGFYPQAIEDFDLSSYDLIISSSAAFAKGVIVGADQVHIAYVHSPARYAWDMTHDYLNQAGLNKGIKGYMAKKILSQFRIWDSRTPNGVDVFVANSEFIRKRIWRVYRREAEVIYPPVAIERFTLEESKEDFFLTASRMVPYKRIDLIASAFTRMPEKKLVIIGDGPEMPIIKDICKGHSNITLMGYQNNDVLVDMMRKAKAFVFAAKEDFGIVPVEAQACGTPVIAYGAGGALETVVDIKLDNDKGTGLFFDNQTEDSLIEAVREFDQYTFVPLSCRKNAEKFSPEIFRKKLKDMVSKSVLEKK